MWSRDSEKLENHLDELLHQIGFFVLIPKSRFRIMKVDRYKSSVVSNVFRECFRKAEKIYRNCGLGILKS